MTKPIYFPFTYIPESTAALLSGFMGPVTVFQPIELHRPETLGRLERDGHIEIRVPAADNEDRLAQCLSEFTEWGRLHHGEETSLKDFFKTGFSRNNFTAQIRTDILKDGKEDTSEPDPLFLSRLFLLMAQDLDAKQSEINEELASSIDDEQDLFTGMTGEQKVPDPAKESLFKNDFGVYQTGSRISAWFRLLETAADESAFLVTSSRAVFEEMLEKFPGLINVREFNNIPFQQPETVISEFAGWITQLATTPWPESGECGLDCPDFSAGSGQKINFKLYILPETDPKGVFRLIAKDPPVPGKQETRGLNTLIGIFEI